MNPKGLHFQLYRAVYQGVGLLVQRSGPFGPLLTRLAVKAHDRVIPPSFYVSNPVLADGFVIHHEGLPVTARSLATGMYEADTKRLLQTLVRPGMTILDVGANIGYFSLLLARLVDDDGHVWAFEPAPRNIQLLRKNVADNMYDDRISIVPQAVSNAQGTVRFYVSPGAMGLSSLYENASGYERDPLIKEQDGIDVACTTLDDWAALHAWPSVDLIKIDVEGAEKSVFEGMLKLSSKNPDIRVIAEFNIRTLQAAQTTPAEFFAAMQMCGFSNIHVIGDKLRPLGVPADIPWLIRDMRRCGYESVNLLGEKKDTL